KMITMYAVIFIMFVVIIYPMLWTFGISLNPGSNVYGAQMIPENWSFVHYEWLFTDTQSMYLTWYKNTLIGAAASSFLSVVFVTLTAYASSRYRFVGRRYGLYAFLILHMFPVLRAMVAIYILLNTIGPLDSLW